MLSYRLINATGNTVHPIYDQGNSATNSSYTYNITNILQLTAGTNVVVTNDRTGTEPVFNIATLAPGASARATR